MLTNTLLSALGAFSLLLDGVTPLKAHLGDLSRRNQKRVDNIVREAQEKHLNPRQMNGTTGNSTGSRFLTSATQSKNPFMSTQESI